MPWIECHQYFFDHPKTVELAAHLRCSEEKAIVGLLRFWFWCLDYAPDGDLRPYKPAELARAFRYPQARADHLVSAMIESGWLDLVPYFRVHEWWDHVGLFLQGRYKRKPEVWHKIRDLYEERSPGDEKPEIVPGIADRDTDPRIDVPEQLQSSTSAVPEQSQNSTRAVPAHITVPDITEQDKTNTTTSTPISPSSALGGGGGGGGRELEARIQRISEIRAQAQMTNKQSLWSPTGGTAPRPRR
jgi:hypothetical protein